MASRFNMINFIEKKKINHVPHTNIEIQDFIENLVDDKIPDYQTAAWLMSVYFNGMNLEETTALTKSMIYSGKTLNLKDLASVDKHSTGGVGDKTSFLIAPMAASLGLFVPMMAGRGLGHTGGTIDKVETFKNYRTELGLDEFETLIRSKGMALVGQSDQVAPADKRLYALRDVTATIDSAPLITASILSKKFAEGANGLALDLKVGNGAFMQTLEEGKKLAQLMLDVASQFEKKCSIMITNMSQPLGKTAGHATEINEVIHLLKSPNFDENNDLMQLSLELTYEMALMSGLYQQREDVKKALEKKMLSGEVYDKFCEMIKNQSDEKTIELREQAKERYDLTLEQEGWIESIDTKGLGLALIQFGGGRLKKTDQIDHQVGFEFHHKVGSKIKADTPVLSLYAHHHQKELVQKELKSLSELYKVSRAPVEKPKLILQTMRNFKV